MKEVHAALTSQWGESPALEGVRATGVLRGALLSMSVEQRFRNTTAKAMEVVYTFPLPWKAALLGVDVVLGGRRLSGAATPRDVGQQRYEEALSEGNAAILLERNYDDSYSLNLGNLLPGEACEITLRYAQVLTVEQQSLRILVPTVIAPRYGDPVLDAGLQPHQRAAHSLAAHYPFEISIHLHGQHAGSKVSVPSHAASFAIAGDVLTVSLAADGALDRDFVLVVDQPADASLGILARDAVQPGHIAMLASFTPQVKGASLERPVAVKILVDCSGSMEGASLDAARRALLELVPQLREGDRFSLSRFGSNVEHRSRGLWSATQASRHAAIGWLSSLKADMGGTNMEDALRSAFALTPEQGCDLVLVTDGDIHAIEPTVEAARSAGHRIFVVAVGSSPSQGVLRRLADETGGVCDFVAAGEAVRPSVLRMFSRLRGARLTAPELVWPAGVTPVWTSELKKYAYGGDSFNVFALLDRPLSGDVVLRAIDERESTIELDRISFHGEADKTDTLSRVMAHSRFEALQATADGEEAAIALAVQYQLVTGLTNYLLVHARCEEERATDMPVLHQVQSMVPAGRSRSSGLTTGAAVACDIASFDVACASQSFSFSFGDDWEMSAALPASRTESVAGKDAKQVPRTRSLQRSFDDLAMPEEKVVPEVTPRELIESIWKLPVGTWPRTFAGLRELGAAKQFVEWLYKRLPGDELAVVAGFLQFIGSPDALEKLRGRGQALDNWGSFQIAVAELN